MSVLQIVGTVVGAVIGTIIEPGGGTLIGASIGGAIGAGVNSIVNPVRIEGARLGDLTVVSSATGTVRPVGYGKVRVAGNVIWATPIIEHSSTSKGGGKGGPVTTNYTYGATFALALCEGVVSDVLRIWADSKLVYDVTAGSDNVKREGFNFRFYPGDETQVADSIIESHEGVGNVPGYRGTCYLVFDDIPLTDYGNRIPNITAEVVFASEPAFDYEFLIRADPSIFGDLNATGVIVNPISHIGYVASDDPAGIVEFDVDTMQTIRERTLADIVAPLGSGDDGGSTLLFNQSNMIVGWDQALYFRTFDLTHGPHIVRVDPNTLLATAEFYSSNAGVFFGPTDFADVTLFCFVTMVDPSSGMVSNLVCANTFGALGTLSVPDLGYVWHNHPDPLPGTVPQALVQGTIRSGSGDAWVLTIDDDFFYFNLITFDGAGISLGLAGSFTPADVDPAATIFVHGFRNTLIYDESDDSLLTIVTTDTGSFHVKWNRSSGILFATPIDPLVGTSEADFPFSRISTGSYARLTQNAYVEQINTATGALIQQTLWPITLGAAGARQVYDSGSQIIIAYVTETAGFDPQWAKIRIGRVTASAVTLGDIFADQCERAGFVSGDFDVTELTDVVQGFVISQRALVIDVLKPFLGVYLVDAIESDNKLVFRHRGGSTVADITEDELVRTDDNAEPFVETRQQEIELPMRVTLTYIDADKDFQQNTQMAKRSRHPNPTVLTDNQTDLQLAVVSTATPAKQMAERILFSVWNERASFAVRLPPKYGYLDAGDPVTLTLNDGYVIRGRLIKADVGVDFSIDATIVIETDGQYVSIAEADDAIPWSGSDSIPSTAPSKLILLDTPLLRDQDDEGRTAVRGYWAAGSYRTTGGWPGAVLQASTDTATWVTAGTAGIEMTWGSIEVAPADPDSFFRTQFDGTMTVRIAGGTYVPVASSDLGLANLENPMAIIKQNGEVEIVQYRDVAALGSDRYTLSVFYRGVRGSDAMGGGIVAGDTFVFLSTSGVNELSVPISAEGVIEFYRIITAGALSPTALIQPFAYHGRDLMPYAPMNGEAALSGSDIVLTWVRRTRIGGEMRDGIDTVPLAEATEAYEIDILDGPGGSVLRTLTSTTSTVTYTAAQITADFGTTPDELSVDIYQMSDVVGRGFTTEQLLEVA